MSTTAATASAPSPFALTMRQALSRWGRYLPPALITLILLVVHSTIGVLEGYGPTALAIGASMLTEAVLSLVLLRRWPNLSSAYMSGVSVGVLIRSPYYWPYALCSMISITSKYALRWRGRHICNPSNFGLSTMFFLAPGAAVSLSFQWSNSIWPVFVIWCLGMAVVWQAKRGWITASYVVSFLALAAVRCTITGNSWLAEVAPLTGPMYQLYIFFMITDPKTTVRSRQGQCVMAFLVAFVEMLIRLMGDVHAPYYALFLVGPVAFAIEIWRESRRQVGHLTPAPVPQAS